MQLQHEEMKGYGQMLHYPPDLHDFRAICLTENKAPLYFQQYDCQVNQIITLRVLYYLGNTLTASRLSREMYINWFPPPISSFPPPISCSVRILGSIRPICSYAGNSSPVPASASTSVISAYRFGSLRRRASSALTSGISAYRVGHWPRSGHPVEVLHHFFIIEICNFGHLRWPATTSAPHSDLNSLVSDVVAVAGIVERRMRMSHKQSA